MNHIIYYIIFILYIAFGGDVNQFVSSGRNGINRASSNSLRHQEPNTSKIPTLHDFSQT
jgi:hypothetical protein